MPFTVANGFIKITVDDNSVNGLSRIKKSVEALQTSFDKLQDYSKKFLIALAGAGTFAVKAFADSEEASISLKAALAATGQEVDSNLNRLKEFAANFETLTNYERSATVELMAFATNLGVTADHMQDIISNGIGLGTAIFDGDAKAGIEAFVQAQAGNFRQLQRLVPEIRNARTEQEKWAAVLKLSRIGFDEAQEKTTTFYGSLKALYNSAADAARGFGELLLPSLKQVGTMLQGVAMYIRDLTPEQKQHVLHWLEIGAAIATTIAFGPKLISFAGSILAAFKGIVSVSTGLLSFLATTPIGWLIDGIAAVAVAFAYASGSGDTFAKRTIDGMMKIVGFLDPMLGSWAGFLAGMNEIWDAVGAHMLEVWINIKAQLMTLWSNTKQGFIDIWYLAADAVAEWAVRVWGTMQQLCNSLIQLWDKTTSGIGNALGAIEATQQNRAALDEAVKGKKIGQTEVNKLAGLGAIGSDDGSKKIAMQMYGGKVLNDDQMQGMRDRMNEQSLNYQNSEIKKTNDAKEKQFKLEQAGIEGQVKAQQESIRKWKDSGLTQSSDDNSKALSDIDKDKKTANESEAKLRAKQFKEDQDMLAKMPKLSDKLQGYFNSVKDYFGLGSGEDIAKKIQDEKDKAKAGVGGLGNPQFNGSQAKPSIEKVEDVMKRNLAAQLLGGAMSDPAKVQEAQLSQLQQINKFTNNIHDFIKTVNFNDIVSKFG